MSGELPDTSRTRWEQQEKMVRASAHQSGRLAAAPRRPCSASQRNCGGRPLRPGPAAAGRRLTGWLRPSGVAAPANIILQHH